MRDFAVRSLLTYYSESHQRLLVSDRKV